MKFRVDRKALADTIAVVAKSLPSKPPTPVLAGVKITADSGVLRVEGFDYETSTRAHVVADVLDEGSVLVSGKLLADITKALPQKPVEVSVDGARVGIVCGSAKFSLPTMPVADYPALPAFPATTGSLPTEVFETVVGQVAAAAGKDDTLPMLTGVKIEAENGTLTLAATDRFRLAIRTLDWTGGDVNALIPAKTLADVARDVSRTQGLDNVDVGFHEGLFGADTGNVWTTARVLDAEFPKFRQLLPSEHSAVAGVDVAELVGAVKRVGLVAERGAQIRLTFDTGSLTVTAGTDGESSAEETLAATFAGEPLTIAFNPGYLLDGLNVIGTERVLFGFTTPNRPATLRPLSGDMQEYVGAGPFQPADTSFVYLLMPVRLPGNN
ncbi:DNA polymerase III subunit beta [Rhodococcus ruber]|uniref:DNA polymerase III subunit beta n=1 Tax=Rhodococcus ruber TaxID=1830 RepID=UPI0022B5DFDB|nr:DNA polymerase III subunit beta [Rhodococcus ruber]MCZ4506409.1 DNA polymerase III subunit beta [Rhodococcus ruber]